MQQDNFVLVFAVFESRTTPKIVTGIHTGLLRSEGADSSSQRLYASLLRWWKQAGPIQLIRSGVSGRIKSELSNMIAP